MATQIERWFNQDLSKSVPTRMIGNLYYQDQFSLKLGVRVFKDGAPVALDGTITGYCVLADGSTVTITGIKQGNPQNEAYIILSPAAYMVPGLVHITIVNTSGAYVTTLLSAGGVVVKGR